MQVALSSLLTSFWVWCVLALFGYWTLSYLSSKQQIKCVRSNVTNIVSTNISPRVQKDIIGFISENVGKHRQYIGNVKKYKNIKKYKKEKNHNIFEKIGKYRDKIGKYREKIEKKSPKKSGKYRSDILPIYRQWVNIAISRDVADISVIFVTLG